MARPPQKVTRQHQIAVRVTRLEKKVIQRSAEDAGMNPSEFMRKAALNKEIKFRLNPDEVEALKELRQFQRNFQRISNYLNPGQDEEVKSEVRELIKESKAILNRLK